MAHPERQLSEAARPRLKAARLAGAVPQSAGWMARAAASEQADLGVVQVAALEAAECFSGSPFQQRRVPIGRQGLAAWLVPRLASDWVRQVRAGAARLAATAVAGVR